MDISNSRLHDDSLGRDALDLTARIGEALGRPRIDALVVLGSGWRGASRALGETGALVDLASVNGMARSPVAGHESVIRAVTLAGGSATALVVGTRTHLYEGHGPEAVTRMVRAAAALGARRAVLTNGAGSTRADLEPGRVVLISDHINLTGTSPLLGATFVDMTDAYSPALRGRLRELDPLLTEGVYAQFRGPQYETPAEVAMAARLGADLVGMSTALETIAARAAGLEVLGLSLVTNLGAGLASTALHHDDVTATGRSARARLASVMGTVAETLSSTAALRRSRPPPRRGFGPRRRTPHVRRHGLRRRQQCWAS